MSTILEAFIPITLNPELAPTSSLHSVRLLARMAIFVLMCTALLISMLTVYIKAYGFGRAWVMLIPGLNLYALWRLGIKTVWWIFLLIALIIGLYYDIIHYTYRGDRGRDYQMFTIRSYDDYQEGM